MEKYDNKLKATRFAPVSLMLKKSKGMTILDIGANDGFMSLKLLESGAKLAHVFDILPEKYAVSHPNLTYRSDNICSWEGFEEKHKDILLSNYNIVMFLGTYHHLCEESRYSIFKESMKIATDYYCFRCNNRYFINLKKEIPKKWKKIGQFIWQVL